MAPRKPEDPASTPTPAPESDAPATTDAAEDVENTSSDAQYSTYQRVDQQREGEVNPPPGPQSVQIRGQAQEAAGESSGGGESSSQQGG